jgi:glutathione synthase
MSLAVAIQMDPIQSINIDADSSFVLGLEALERGHSLFHYLPRDLFLRDGRVFATARALQLKRELGNHFKLGTPEVNDRAALDVLMKRQDQQ